VARTPVRRLIEKGIEAGADYIPDAIETPLRKAFSIGVPKSKVSKPKASLAVNPKALPAPPKQLALPAPGPGLPPFAVKTKGGQWFVDKSIGGMRASDLDVKVAQMPDDGRWVVMINKTPMIFDREAEARAKAQSIVDQSNPNRSPENAARRIADNSLRLARDASGPLSQLQDWFLRAAPRYIKNEMGTPDDPMRALAERGGLHIEMSPDEWSDTASSVISRQPIGSYLGLDRLYAPVGADPRAGNDYAASLAVNMPWLQKAPVTDELYGIGDTYALQEKMGMAHLLDEMRNAMDPRSGLPSDLAVRPESLGRMGLAQAAERVGLINQFRAKEMERAALSNMDSPAVQTFKEYADDNPMGLRWAELREPDTSRLSELERQLALARNTGQYQLDTLKKASGDTSYWVSKGEGREKQYLYEYPTEQEAAQKLSEISATSPDQIDISALRAEMDALHPDARYKALEDALKYEGDTMGHCVGNYCPDVMSGKSRIFSLRDAKGEPHVTIETRPGRQDRAYSDAIAQLRGTEYWPAWLENQRTRQDNPGSTQDLIDYMNQFRRSQGLEPIDAEKTQDIVQIKGKQNRAPKDDYLPFVQDFVKSQQWGNVGDLGNTGLVKLPDGRYITPAQVEEALSSANWTDDTRQHVRDRIVDNDFNNSPEIWDDLSRYFEGYAVGGRVCADRCFSKGKSAVYAVNKSRK
jgi:hypothetical protein